MSFRRATGLYSKVIIGVCPGAGRGKPFHKYYFDLAAKNKELGATTPPLPNVSTMMSPKVRISGDIAVVTYSCMFVPCRPPLRGGQERDFQQKHGCGRGSKATLRAG